MKRYAGAFITAVLVAGCAGPPSPAIRVVPQQQAGSPGDRNRPAGARRPRFLHEYRLPLGAYPSSIVTGADGALWFGTYPYFTNHPPTHLGIGRITTQGRQHYFEFGNGVYDIALGSDDNVWFTNPYTTTYSVGSITTHGSVQQYAVPGSGLPESIAADKAGHLWYTAFGGNPDLVEIATSGSTVATYHIKNGNADSVASGPSRSTWFDVVGNPSFVGRITDTGKVRSGPIGGPSYIPGPMALGPDGRMWICDGDMVAAVTRSLQVTRYKLRSGGSFGGITAGPDGYLWGTDAQYSAIVRIATDGTMTQYPTPTPSMIPSAIAVGPDGNIWFTEIQQQTDVSKIGVLQP